MKKNKNKKECSDTILLPTIIICMKNKNYGKKRVHVNEF